MRARLADDRGLAAWRKLIYQAGSADRDLGGFVTFVVSKVLWFVAAPGNFLVLVLLAGVLRVAWSRKRRGFGLIVVAMLGLLAIATLPVGSWITQPLEDRFPAITPQRVDGIVVLGGSVDAELSRVRGQVAVMSAAGRITETAILARRFPAARVVVSGGDGSLFPGTLSEAKATADLLIQLGVAAERIEVEPNSRNTEENAVMSYAVAQPEPGEAWLLLTSAMHMPRAVGCFRRAGWKIIPYPVDYRTGAAVATPPRWLLAEDLILVTLATKEWLGLVAYYWLGRTDGLFPAPG
jgi:uncharacterized SAM-binding protein YcdF (DUF218 family)